MTPFLVLTMKVRPTIAVGTDLMYAALTKWTGAWVHWRQGTVDWQLALRLAYGSVPGGMLAVISVALLKHRHMALADDYVRRALGVMLAVAAVVMLVRTIWGGQIQAQGWFATEQRRRNATIIWGALVGIAVGFTSVGSGTLLMPFLFIVYAIPAARLVGTDIFHAALLMTATALLQWGGNNIEWQLIPWLVTGSLPGVFLGSKLAPRLPQRAIRIGLSVTLLATGARMIP
jgi:hypothetical protein